MGPAQRGVMTYPFIYHLGKVTVFICLDPNQKENCDIALDPAPWCFFFFFCLEPAYFGYCDVLLSSTPKGWETFLGPVYSSPCDICLHLSLWGCDFPLFLAPCPNGKLQYITGPSKPGDVPLLIWNILLGPVPRGFDSFASSLLSEGYRNISLARHLGDGTLQLGPCFHGRLWHIPGREAVDVSLCLLHAHGWDCETHLSPAHICNEDCRILSQPIRVIPCMLGNLKEMGKILGLLSILRS